MHEEVAKATLYVKCGAMVGSGFLYRDPSIALTNFHVIAGHGSAPIEVVSEAGHSVGAKLIGSSPETAYDFAVLKLDAPLPNSPRFLTPQRANPPRGSEIIFAGYPHGITDLLVHEAIVSGPAGANGFYIDGSVNGGNSGGPIVDKNSGEVVGIVTQRRFLGDLHLRSMRADVEKLITHCNAMAARGSIVMNGINFGEFAKMVGGGFALVDDLMTANANSGIGIGFRIEFADDEYQRLGLS